MRAVGVLTVSSLFPSSSSHDKLSCTSYVPLCEHPPTSSWLPASDEPFSQLPAVLLVLPDQHTEHRQLGKGTLPPAIGSEERPIASGRLSNADRELKVSSNLSDLLSR